MECGREATHCPVRGEAAALDCGGSRHSLGMKELTLLPIEALRARSKAGAAAPALQRSATNQRGCTRIKLVQRYISSIDNGEMQVYDMG